MVIHPGYKCSSLVMNDDDGGDDDDDEAQRKKDYSLTGFMLQP